MCASGTLRLSVTGEMDHVDDSPFTFKTRLLTLEPWIYILRYASQNSAEEPCLISLQPAPIGKSSVDFFPGETVVRNTLSRLGDLLIVRVKNDAGTLLITEYQRADLPVRRSTYASIGSIPPLTSFVPNSSRLPSSPARRWNRQRGSSGMAVPCCSSSSVMFRLKATLRPMSGWAMPSRKPASKVLLSFGRKNPERGYRLQLQGRRCPAARRAQRQFLGLARQARAHHCGGHGPDRAAPRRIRSGRLGGLCRM